jgi:dipeptidyl aminopeptidase/acylaminoacyl peptidase
MTDFRAFVPKQRLYPTLAMSPDGTRLAYSTNASGQYNLWVQPVTGAPPRQLTDYTDNAVRSIAWSPDGATIAFEADLHGDEQYQIYVVPAGGGEPRRLTTATDRQHVLGGEPFTGNAGTPFSADGGTLVYAGNDRDPGTQDVLVHDLRTDRVRRVEGAPGEMWYAGSVSPDGRWLLVTGVRTTIDTNCYLVDLTDPAGSPRLVTPHDGEVMHMPGPWAADSSGFYLRTDAAGEFMSLALYSVKTGEIDTVTRPDWDVEHVAVSADGRTLAWTVNTDGVSELHATRDHEPVDLPDVPPGVIDALALSADGGLAALLFDAPGRPREVAVLGLGGGERELRHLTDSRPSGLTAVTPVEPELVRYPTHDGRAIPAWLFRPAGDGPFPVVLSIHGGPEAQELPRYAYSGLYQYLLSRGIGVLAPNVRGSTGYGKSYQRLIHRDWGGDELRDFEYGVRYLRSLGWVRPDRIAVFGGSFGGFATLSCVSRLPDLWAAGVSIVGPSNLVTFARSVPPTWRPLMAKWVGDPDADGEFLLQRSPITYADDIVAPLYVIQGANDPRTVQAESDQIVAKLRARGVEVRYDVYPDEGHGFTNKDNELRAWSNVAEFLCAHLLVD